jgi:hypothetical protein
MELYNNFDIFIKICKKLSFYGEYYKISLDDKIKFLQKNAYHYFKDCKWLVRIFEHNENGSELCYNTLFVWVNNDNGISLNNFIYLSEDERFTDILSRNVFVDIHSYVI